MDDKKKKRLAELTEKAHNNIDMETLLNNGLSKEEAEEAIDLLYSVIERIRQLED